MSNKSSNINNVGFSGGARRDAIEGNISNSSAAIFEKAVVTNIICDSYSASSISQKRIKKISNNLSIEKLPRNSLIVRRISGGADQVGDSYCLAYPLFSSHLAMPIKVGEMVWVLFDRGNKGISNIGYWLSRIHGDEYNEDVNYSHYDRIYEPTPTQDQGPGTANAAEGIVNPSELPPTEDFPNISLKQNPQYPNEYDSIVQSTNLHPHAYEPVPRYTKRPGDLALQGSNNSLIVLTTDRAWTPNDDPSTATKSNAYSSPSQSSGTIDIVAGRARWISKLLTSRTIPNTRKNRRFSEVTKDKRILKQNGLSQKTTEGDPDFKDDASRIYVSMGSSIDTKLGISEQKPIVPGESSPRAEVVSAASIAIKSDQIRIVSRKDLDNGINGSIYILKEGDKSSSGDHACISILDDGSICISGNKIFIGRSDNDGGTADGPSDAPGTSQPYVKYKQLEDLLNKVMDDVTSFCNTLLTHVTPGYGAPSPQINTAATTLIQNMTARKTEIASLKSSRIFGE